MAEFTEDKRQLLSSANSKLNICDDLNIEKNKNLVFIYCPPKVGSTSLVTSFRLCALNRYTVFHIHDELMLKVLCGIENVTVNEIIKYNKSLGKNVYVIDIYRSPIEHKISFFFEKIASIHFNNTEQAINTYDVNKVINRFNKVFPHLSKKDYYKEVYNIPSPPNFNHAAKYINQEIDGIKYIKLRLKDSEQWSQILSDIFGFNIKLINDYETDKKPIRDLYNKFKEAYRIPANFLKMIEYCDILKYYYSEEERETYLKNWRSKSGPPFTAFTKEEYRVYNDISIENQHILDVQRNHYIDEGCICAGCSRKRQIILHKLQTGQKVDEMIDHNQAFKEYQQVVIQRKKEKLHAFVKKIEMANNANIMKKQNKPQNLLQNRFMRQVGK